MRTGLVKHACRIMQGTTTLVLVSPDRPSPDQAEMVLKRLVEAWGLDRYDALALMGASGRDLSTLVWTSDQLLRITYLIELEKALIELNPKFGIPYWIATPKPGPFFEGNSPLQMMTATTRDLVELLKQVGRWNFSSSGRAPTGD